jgi:GAF domain-containing protein
VTALRNGEVAHVSDIRETDRHRSGDTTTRTVVDVEGISAFLPVPLVSRDRSIGCLVLFRQVPVAFTEDQIELARTFAAQAVIAIKTRIPQLIRWFRCPL